MHKRVFILLCAFLIFFCFISADAYADDVTISTIVGGNSYFQTFSSEGTWKNLGTPEHYITQTGEVVYCLQTEKGEPQNASYTEIDGSQAFDTYAVRKGIEIILANGYPNRTEGFTDDEARYATANAIRFFLADCGEPYVPAWMNLNMYSEFFRGKSGYEQLWYWCLDLRNMANAQVGGLTGSNGSVSFSSSSLELSQDGDYYTGNVTVYVSGCQGGYELDSSDLPYGSSVYGYTGNNGDVLSISIPSSYTEQSFTLRANGIGYGSTGEIKYYAPYNTSLQNVVTYVSSSPSYFETIATASMTISTPEDPQGTIRIVKTDSETGAPLANVWFYLYKNGSFHSSNYTNSSGIVEFTVEPGGYTYKEAYQVDGYFYDGNEYPVTISYGGELVSIAFTNDPIHLSSLEILKIDTETREPLGGVTVGLYDSNGTLINSAVSDSSGKISFTGLDTGTYQYGEIFTLPGYLLDENKYEIKISEYNKTYKATLENSKLTGNISITKMDAGGNKLQGAIFQLEANTGTDGAYVVLGTAESNEEGFAYFKSLVIDGVKYRLTEIKAPAGQNLQAGIIFEGEISPDKNELSFTVCNTSRIAMPFTGGQGQIYVLVPVLCIGAFLYTLKRRENLENS